MSFPVYSRVFFAGLVPSGIVNGPGPDAGHVWVVKDIVISLEEDPYSQPARSVVADSNFVTIAAVDMFEDVSTRSFHWYGGQVLESPDHLVLIGGFTTGSISFRISGFELTLP